MVNHISRKDLDRWLARDKGTIPSDLMSSLDALLLVARKGLSPCNCATCRGVK